MTALTRPRSLAIVALLASAGVIAATAAGSSQAFAKPAAAAHRVSASQVSAHRVSASRVSASAAKPAATPARHGGKLQRVAGLPQGVPKAALLKQPALPVPTRAQWPFPSSFSRTSGTGRLAGGASLWTDWVFDDHGAAAPTGAPVSPTALNSTLAPTQGVAAYPPGPAKNNGADIFRAAVGVTRTASYWRVDWNTLVDNDIPIAEWTFDTDNNARTGTSTWPAGAGVHSPGVDKALVVSATGAELINTTSGKTVNVVARGGRLTVNHKVRSFIVRIPRRLLPVSGTWRIRLASGLATANGKAFAEPDYSTSLDLASAALGALPHVYNVTFRTLHQEPPVFTDGSTDAQVAAFQKTVAGLPIDKALGLDGLARFVTGNFWMEDHQADALAAGGNVSAFSRLIDWSRLAHHVRTPQPQPRGYSDRWYVSRLHLGQGAIPNPTTSPEGDLRPNYLSRVQPYAVYVPRHLDLRRKTPLTWILHSLSVNLNQYGALDPKLLQEECQDRHSICATTEGFGPDGWYFDQAEQDFWSVWHALATSYRLDPRRTVISGYSMGGWASYKLGLEHPDLFSQAMPLEGPPDCGVRILELNGTQLEAPAGAGTTGHCSKDGFSTPLLGNAKWLPYDVTQGGLDELVPAPSNLQTTSDLRALGDRYTLFFLPADDHLAYATQDRFAGIVKALGPRIPLVKRDPGQISYTWYPSLDSRQLGIGTTTAYWLTHLGATTSTLGALASVQARSFAIPSRAITTVEHGPSVVSTPLPATRTSLSWTLGTTAKRRDRLALVLTKVKAITVDAARAQLRCPSIVVRSTHAVDLTLDQLRAGRIARFAGRSRRIGRSGRVTLRLPAGRSTAHISCG